MSKRASTAARPLTMLLDALEKATETFGAVLLSIMTLVVLWQVLSRATPALNSPWTEEIALMLLVWFGMTGAAIGVRRGSHIGIEFLTDRLPIRCRRACAVLVSLLILSFSVFLFIEGLALARGCWNDAMSATLLPRGPFVYLAIPVSAFLIMLYSFENVARHLDRKGGGAV